MLFNDICIFYIVCIPPTPQCVQITFCFSEGYFFCFKFILHILPTSREINYNLNVTCMKIYKKKYFLK